MCCGPQSSRKTPRAIPHFSLPGAPILPLNQKPQPGQNPIQDWQVADWERRIGDLFIQAARELDEAKRKALYGEMQKIAQEQVP